MFNRRSLFVLMLIGLLFIIAAGTSPNFSEYFERKYTVIPDVIFSDKGIFSGYQSDIHRIDPVNLTAMALSGESAGLDVKAELRRMNLTSKKDSWVKIIYLTIEKDLSEIERVTWRPISVTIIIDEESDIELSVDCSEKLDNPSELFIPIFDVLGIPLSALDEIEFTEIYRLTDLVVSSP